MNETANSALSDKCRWCGCLHGTLCPIVKEIEYFECGAVKRVVFKVPADYAIPLYPFTPSPPQPYYTPWQPVLPLVPYCVTSFSGCTDLSTGNGTAGGSAN